MAKVKQASDPSTDYAKARTRCSAHPGYALDLLNLRAPAHAAPDPAQELAVKQSATSQLRSKHKRLNSCCMSYHNKLAQEQTSLPPPRGCAMPSACNSACRTAQPLSCQLLLQAHATFKVKATKCGIKDKFLWL